MSRLAVFPAVPVLALACWLGLETMRAAGQFGAGPVPIPGRVSTVPDQPRVQPPTDRTLSRGLARSQQSIDAGEFALAIRFLDDVLGRQADVFIETGASGGYTGMKERARQMIRDLPPAGRQAYAAAYAPIAERELRAAMTAVDPAALAAVAQRYFYTPAGFEAAFLAAAEEADAGRHLSAALLYEQLLETPEAVRRYDPSLSVRAAASWMAAGDPVRAANVLGRLTARGAQTVEVGGRGHRLDSTAEPLDWLRDTVGEPANIGATPQREWITFRGNSARSGETDGGLPHMRVRWRVRLMNHPRLEELFEDFQANLLQSGDVAPVASAPLAAGDYVLVRTPHGMLAVDFRTGKRVWRSEPQRDRELEQLVRGGAEEGATNPEAVRSFARRIWQDYLYGVPSSDGARVYMIRDLPMPASVEYDVAPWLGGAAVEAAQSANRLCAYDLATQGKLVWEIDGASATGELAGAFFLGAPLAVGPSLYALAEIKGEIFLAALDRATGGLQWRQQLANLETGVMLDLDRRLQSAMPSYDGGMLVCPTGAGLVVGVDLAKRSLAWAYRYDAKPRREIVYGGASGRERTLSSHWTDGAATIVGDRVLVTPPESQELHCLDLRSGKLLWKRPRGAMVRLACVHDGTILLAGNKALAGVRLSDGKPAWKRETLDLPAGSAPSGSGFLSDGRYFLPLTTAEVAAIHVAEGKIVARAGSRDGESLGNLICHRGSVISQNGLFLDCFDQIDVLKKRAERRLAKHPDDVEALRTLGEVAYNDGRLGEAIGLLERAYLASPNDLETHDVLAECLASALDEDFAAFQDKLPLLKQLEGGALSRRLSILRIESQGLLAGGEPLKSAQACFELYQLAGPIDEMLDIGQDHQVAASRWVAGQMAANWQAANADERKAIADKVRELAAAADDAPKGAFPERFLSFFGTLPETDELTLEQARQWNDDQRIFESQQLLLDLRKSNDPAIQAEATARVAAQLHMLDLHGLAADLDRVLLESFGDAKCLDGATGRELVSRWRTADALDAQWPRGRVEVGGIVPAGGAPATSRARAALRSVRWERGDEILGRATALVSSPARGGEFVLQDGTGREFFRAVLEQENPNQFRPPGNVYGVSHGNLVVVSMGRQIAAFNTLPGSESASPPILWRAQLSNNLDFDQPYFDDPSGGASRRPGSFRPGRSADHGDWVGVIGPVTGRSCVFQDQRRLACVDALTGEVRWSRTDVPPGCDLYGDDKVVVAQGKGMTMARVFRTEDGRELGAFSAPPWEEQLATMSERVIRWRRTDNSRHELSCQNIITGETDWRYEFSPGAKVDVDQGRYVAVVELEGRATILDAASGQIIVDQKTARQPGLEEVHLMVGADAFVLIADQRSRGRSERAVRPFNPLDSSVVSGEAYLFDRTTGTLRWSRPAELYEQALLAAQGADLPFIAFAGMLQTRNTSVLVVDKATGRTLYSADDLPPANAGSCTARVTNAAAHEASLELGGRTIILKFTEAPRPPEPPALAEVESNATRKSGGLLRIFQNLGE